MNDRVRLNVGVLALLSVLSHVGFFSLLYNQAKAKPFLAYLIATCLGAIFFLNFLPDGARPKVLLGLGITGLGGILSFYGLSCFIRPWGAYGLTWMILSGVYLGLMFRYRNASVLKEGEKDSF